jgi:enoyl-CoA hydratase/carnithine racemase
LRVNVPLHYLDLRKDAMPEHRPVAVEVEGPTAVITLASPPANALSHAVVDGLDAALDTVEREGPRVVVIRSSVEGFFMAGADIKLLRGFDPEGFARYLMRLRAVLERIAGLPAVSIAAVDGYALGGGMELAAACTLRVAGPAAKLGVPEIKLGILPGGGGTQRLARLLGRGAALDLLLTGRTVTAAEARSIGLIDRLAGGGADAEAQSLADLLAGYSATALAAIVRCVDAAEALPMADGMAAEADEVLALFAGEDAREGVRAFLEKRPAMFS